MTDWIINELSLAGQFKDPHSFVATFRSLLAARQKSEALRNALRCTTATMERPVCNALTLKQAVDAAGDRNIRMEAIRWFANQGPFWTAEQAVIDDDLFFFGELDVTASGLGEVARRRLLSGDSHALSFRDAVPAFDANPLLLTHGLLEQPLGRVSVPNWTDVDALLAACEQTPPQPATWEESIRALKQLYPDAWFAPNLLHFLDGEPFVPYVHERAAALIGVLYAMIATRMPDGSWSERGKELHDLHFVGDKAWFTDESDTNKVKFKQDMTFELRTGMKQLCGYHGKIKTPQYRIHFPWPPKKDDPLEIAYIGPKLTKG